MIYILFWWLIAQVLGWLALPTAMRIFRWLPDRGYTASKALGLLLASYFLWLGGSTGLLRNDLGGILFSILLVAGISAWFFFRGRKWMEIPGFLRQHIRLVLTVEILFTVSFIAWAVLRAYAPFKIDPAGGEKFMEIAFLNATLRSPQFPPLDPWLSGFAISYYYFGYVMMALVTRLSGAPAGIGFDLYDALLFALTVIGAFGVVYNLVAHALRARAGKEEAAKRSNQPLWAGLLGSLLVAVMGNLEGLWEALHSKGLLPAVFWQWLDIPNLASAQVSHSFYPGSFMWWWRASRVLHDVDFAHHSIEAIDEFPFFSFLLGDNHPHVLALPFVLLAIALVFNLLLKRFSSERGTDKAPEAPKNPPWWNPVAMCFDGDWLLFIFSGLIIGALGFLNTWDMPIYLGLAVLAYGLADAFMNRRLDWNMVLRSAVFGVSVGVVSVLMYIFFYLSFSSQAKGILPYVFPPTRLPQYLTMFGALIFLAACFLLVYLGRQPGGIKPWVRALSWWLRLLVVCVLVFVPTLVAIGMSDVGRQLSGGQVQDSALVSALGGMNLNQALRAVVSARLRDPWLLLSITVLIALSLAIVEGLLKRRAADSGGENAQPAGSGAPLLTVGSDLLVFLLIFTGLALTLTVEFVYLHDSFGSRMNTVFKFYYQGWVMLGLAGAYAAWWLVNRLKSKVWRSLFLAGAGLLIAAGMVYTVLAGWSRVDGFQSKPNLDGIRAIASANPDDWAAIEWLNANAKDAPVILEAPSGMLNQGGSYRYEGRISAFTGLPDVLGWAVHESQWRGSYDEQGKREPDIATIYTTNDGQTALDLLHKWGVSYIILGNPELSYINLLCSDPARHCSTAAALRKFEILFTPVFTQGVVTIYSVP